jgi:tetratricopeptide (TPR) repeat protein
MTQRLLRATFGLVLLAVAAGQPVHAQNAEGRVGPVERRIAPDSNTFAILPFTVSGPKELDYLGESVMDLLTSALDGRGGIRVLYPAQVIRRLGAGPGVSDAMAASPVVRDLGAGRVIGGAVVASGSELRIRLDIFDAPRATRQVTLNGRGTVTSIANAVDSLASLVLARRLVPASVREQRGLAEYATPSPDALRALLTGEQAMRRGRYREAADSLKSALRFDPEFGLAYARLLENEGRLIGAAGEGFSRAEMVVKARAHQSKFSPRIQSVIAFAGAYEQGHRVRVMNLVDALARDYPSDGGVARLQADMNFHFGINLDKPRAQVVALFERALEMNADDVELLQHFGALQLEMGDTTGMLQSLKRCEAIRAGACGSRGGIDIKYGRSRPWAQPFAAEIVALQPPPGEIRVYPDDLARGAAVVDSGAIFVSNPENRNVGQRRNAYIGRTYAAYLNGRYEAAWAFLDSSRTAGPPEAQTWAAHLRLYNLVTGLRADTAMTTLALPAPGAAHRLALRTWYAAERLPPSEAERFIADLKPSVWTDSLLFHRQRTARLAGAPRR